MRLMRRHRFHVVIIVIPPHMYFAAWKIAPPNDSRTVPRRPSDCAVVEDADPIRASGVHNVE